MTDTTPMMKQYKRIKSEHRDTILFFRLGDFYEMFDSDAKEVSSLLNLTLTARHGVPMCGIPYHAAQNYLSRLLRAGKKIAICEQISLPEKGKGIAERQVTEILTPGTIVDENFLDCSRNNFLLSLGKYGANLSMAWLDLSTADFFVSSHPYEERLAILKRELSRLSPREILIQESILEEDRSIKNLLEEQDNLVLNRLPEWHFDMDNSMNNLKRHFNTSNLKAFGLSDPDPAVLSAGILLEYVENTSKNLLKHINTLTPYIESSYVGLDESTQKNLELVKNLQDGSKKFTLLEILDFTVTAPGSRKLRNWILNPLLNKEMILIRQNRVELLYKSQSILAKLREKLKQILDVSRLASRVALDKAHGKDLLAIRNSLGIAEEVFETLGNLSKELLPLKEEERHQISETCSFLQESIHDDPSIVLTEGRLIKQGFNQELDGLKGMKKDSQGLLNEYLEKERVKSGINSLKIRYNRIIGYFFEVTKSNLSLVPPHFIRRQSLVGGERYTTEELIDLETRLNTASERIVELEKELFLEIRGRVKEKIPLLIRYSEIIAELDCYMSFAQAATVRGYRKPIISPDSGISISGGRHPVVEAHLDSGEFVPNSIYLDNNKKYFLFITGPNMAGKSTFLRQTALIAIMAQIGSFVPAEEAKIGLVDKIFCRVGAQDNLARGESTFLVEMNETAYILRCATKKSLIIMDEVGRGTGTRDGFSLAQAVSEYLIEKIKAKTLFATHFHELTSLSHPAIENLSLSVVEDNGKVHFLKKVISGPANNSYGIYVARLAGLPEIVISRAEDIILNWKDPSPAANVQICAKSPKQNELFSPIEMIEKEIRSISPDSITPLQALTRITQWKDLLKKIKT